MDTYLILEEKFFSLSDFALLVSELNILFLCLRLIHNKLIKKPINVNSNKG